MCAMRCQRSWFPGIAVGHPHGSLRGGGLLRKRLVSAGGGDQCAGCAQLFPQVCRGGCHMPRPRGSSGPAPAPSPTGCRYTIRPNSEQAATAFETWRAMLFSASLSTPGRLARGCSPLRASVGVCSGARGPRTISVTMFRVTACGPRFTARFGCRPGLLGSSIWG